MLYQRVYNDPGLMRVGRSGQAQFGVDLLGADRRSPTGISSGIQCKHYQAKKFTLRTVTDDVTEADNANLAIEHLTFATTAPANADVVRQVHELSEHRRRQGKFSVSVEYWNTIQAHIRMFPEIGRAFIPGFPGGALLHVQENVLTVLSIAEEHATTSQREFEVLKAGHVDILRGLSDLQTSSARSLSPEPKGNEADPGIVVSLNHVRDRLREGKTRDARKLLEELGDPSLFRDDFSRFRWHTNVAAVDLIDGRLEPAAAEFLNAFEFARDDERAHINRVRAYLLQNKVETAGVMCEEALVRFPTSGALWGLRLHVRFRQGEEPEGDAVPTEARETADYLFSLARIHGDKGDQATAIELLKKCIELDGGSLEARRAYLAEALMWVGPSSVAAFFGQMPQGHREALEDALQQFEPLNETLASIQSVELSAELATNITSSLKLLGQLDRARAITAQLLMRHPALEQLLRIRLVELVENNDKKNLKALARDRLDLLPPSALAILAEASANQGDVTWNAEILGVVSRRSEEDARLVELAPLAAVAIWRQGDHAAALDQAKHYVAQRPDHVFGHVVFADMLIGSGRFDEAKHEARTCNTLLPDEIASADALQVANLLMRVELYVEAASLYERFIENPCADELTTNWLQCLVSSNQRKKALLALEKLRPEDRTQQLVRHIEINLAARMMDWARMRDLLEPDLTEVPIRADVALGFGNALYRLNDIARLRHFVATDPTFANARVDQELEFAKLQVAAGIPEQGLQRLFRLFRMHPNDSQVAGFLFMQVLAAKSLRALEVPVRVVPGCAVELRSQSESWWVAIDHDDADPVESWPELVSSTSAVAQELKGAEAGSALTVTRGIATVEAQVARIVSLFAYAVEKARGIIASVANTRGPVWSMKVVKNDGELDIDMLLQQSRRRREQAEAAFALYRDHRIPIGLLAQLIGTDSVTLRLDWPYKEASLFVGLGTEDERHAAQSAIQQPGQRFVVDLFTIAEVVLQKTGDSVVQTVGRPLVPESQRQKLLEIIQKSRVVDRATTMHEHNGRLRIVELSNRYQHQRASFLRSMLAFIDDCCEVVATAGPEEQSRELRELAQILDDPSADCILLCLERGAALLTEDGGLRQVAAPVGVAKSSGLQPVWLEALARDRLSHSTYVNCLASKLLGNHDFVAVAAPDLMQLATHTPGKVHPAVRAAFQSFRRPTLMFSSGVKVCADFLRLAVRKLPPSTTGRYAVMAVEVLAYGGRATEDELKKVFAPRLGVFGRNGRHLPRHIRRLFRGMLSRQYRRR